MVFEFEVSSISNRRFPIRRIQILALVSLIITSIYLAVNGILYHLHGDKTITETAARLEHFLNQLNYTATKSELPPSTSPNAQLENAAIVFLARNSEVYGVLSSMQNIEDRFNREYGYQYIFLNDVEFSDEFKKYSVWFVCNDWMLKM
jgi:hypothetical protein